MECGDDDIDHKRPYKETYTWICLYLFLENFNVESYSDQIS